MTRAERRRLLDADRRLAFGQALSDLFAQWGYTLRETAYVRAEVREDDEATLAFVLDSDGDLTQARLRDWARNPVKVAERLEMYKANVASGEWDKAKDTIDEDVPEAKAKPPTLPLTKGQRVVRRDGQVVMVTEITGHGHTAIARTDLPGPSSVWAETGWGHRTDGLGRDKDIVADAE